MSDNDVPDYPLLNPMQEGWLPISVDEAIEAAVIGDHPEANQGFVAMDVALNDLLRCGAIKAARSPEGALSYGVTEHGALVFAILMGMGCEL